MSEAGLLLLTRCTALRSLDLSDVGDVVSARLLGELFASMPLLEELRVARCNALTNQLVHQLERAIARDAASTAGRLVNLRLLALDGCVNVSRASLCSLLQAVRPRCVIYWPEN